MFPLIRTSVPEANVVPSTVPSITMRLPAKNPGPLIVSPSSRVCILCTSAESSTASTLAAVTVTDRSNKVIKAISAPFKRRFCCTLFIVKPPLYPQVLCNCPGFTHFLPAAFFGIGLSRLPFLQSFFCIHFTTLIL